jgi:anti-sigma factor RsiW
MTAHTDVGAYAMGLLEERDRREFEDHLAGCPACAAEVAELSPMAALLRAVELTGAEPAGAEGGEPVAGREPGGGDVTELLRRRARRQRQRRRWQVALGAAAGIVLIGGGIGVGIAAAPQNGPPAPPPLALTGQLHSATDPGTGVAGTVGLVAKAWGTQVTLDLSKVHGPAECELVAVSRTGERRVVMGWLVTAPGDGVPGHPAHLVIRGGTSIPRSDLSRVDVDVVNGRTLVSIPV